MVDTTWMQGETSTTSFATITTKAGRTRGVPSHVDVLEVVGLDPDGRFVVDPMAGYDNAPHDYLFGLTLCCNAYDKGTESGVVCRSCYGTKRNADVGEYLYPNKDGEFPDLDPVWSVTTTTIETNTITKE